MRVNRLFVGERHEGNSTKQEQEVIPSILKQKQRFRGGLVSKAHRLCVILNSRLESNKEEEETINPRP